MRLEGGFELGVAGLGGGEGGLKLGYGGELWLVGVGWEGGCG